MKLLYQTHSPYARKVLVAAHEMGLHHRLQVLHHETSPTRRNPEVFALNPLGKVPVLICDDGMVLFDSNVICEYLDGLHRGPRLIPSQPQSRFRVLRMQALAQGIADAGITARWESERRPQELRWPIMHDGQILKVAAACDFLEQELATRHTDAPATNTTLAPSTAPATSAAPAPSTARDTSTTRAPSTAPATNTTPASSTATATDHAHAAGHGNSNKSVTPGNRPPDMAGLSVTPTNPHPDIGDIALATALSWIEFRRVYDFLTGRPRLAHWYAALCARPSMRATTLEGQTHD
jgi:glutathione S-transferase